MSLVDRDANGKPIGHHPVHFGDPGTQGWYLAPDGPDPEKHLAHAWFIGYAPAEHPQIAFCVLVEYGEAGGRVAGAIAHDLLVDCIKRGYLSEPANRCGGESLPLTHSQRQFDSAARRPPTIPYGGGAAPMPAAAANAPPPPAPPPRPVTPAANRRSWTEPLVRFWILATAGLVAIGGWFVTQQSLASRSEQWLIANGTTVKAVLIETDGDSRIGKKSPPGSPCTLKIDWQGQTVDLHGTLTSNAFLTNGETVSLHVDPNDPTDWTDRQTPEPLARRLIAGAVIIPAALITALAAVWLRRRVLGVWREGNAALYTVLEMRHSALAPLSHSVRCVVNTGEFDRDHRLSSEKVAPAPVRRSALADPPAGQTPGGDRRPGV